jgi:hypothetical protein
MLEAITDRNIEEALAILSRGFPSRSVDFWRSGLARLEKYHDTAASGPVGYIMRAKGEPAGVMLTMRSARQGDAGVRSVLNLSSWYVDEQHRWLAPRMLQKVLAEEADLVTDLTPSEPVRAMIQKLGFVRRHEGVLVAVLGLAALQFDFSASVSTFRDGDTTIGAGARRLLADHAELGCVAAVLNVGGTAHPLVFSPTRRKQLASARLVYAPDPAVVRAHIGAIARYLLAQGVLFAEIPANRGDSAFGAWFTTRPPPTFVRGELASGMVDHAYSEFVFLQI